MDLTTLIIQLISGAIGGNAVGAAAKNVSLGTLGNTIAGAVGGGVGGQILNAVLGLGGAAVTGAAATGAAASGLDITTIVQGFLTGGVSGGATALVIGLLKSKFAS